MNITPLSSVSQQSSAPISQGDQGQEILDRLNAAYDQLKKYRAELQNVQKQESELLKTLKPIIDKKEKLVEKIEGIKKETGGLTMLFSKQLNSFAGKTSYENVISSSSSKRGLDSPEREALSTEQLRKKSKIAVLQKQEETPSSEEEATDSESNVSEFVPSQDQLEKPKISFETGGSFKRICDRLKRKVSSSEVQEMIKAFIAIDPKAIDQQDEDGRTMLFLAAQNGLKAIAELLIQNDADTAMPGTFEGASFTPLEVACLQLEKYPGKANQYNSIISSLGALEKKEQNRPASIEKPGTKNSKDTPGEIDSAFKTLFSLCKSRQDRNPRWDRFKTLLNEFKGPINARNANFQTLLFVAIQNKAPLETIRSIVQKGANACLVSLDENHEKTWTPLQMATHLSLSREIIHFLTEEEKKWSPTIQKGDPEAHPKDLPKQYQLIRLIIQKNWKDASTLLDSQKEWPLINLPLPPKGRTALHSTAIGQVTSQSSLEVFEKLLQKGADLMLSALDTDNKIKTCVEMFQRKDITPRGNESSNQILERYLSKKSKSTSSSTSEKIQTTPSNVVLGDSEASVFSITSSHSNIFPTPAIPLQLSSPPVSATTPALNPTPLQPMNNSGNPFFAHMWHKNASTSPDSSSFPPVEKMAPIASKIYKQHSYVEFNKQKYQIVTIEDQNYTLGTLDGKTTFKTAYDKILPWVDHQSSSDVFVWHSRASGYLKGYLTKRNGETQLNLSVSGKPVEIDKLQRIRYGLLPFPGKAEMENFSDSEISYAHRDFKTFTYRLYKVK